MTEQITNKVFLTSAEYKDSIFDFCANYYNLFINCDCDLETKLNNFKDLLKWRKNSDESLEVTQTYSENEYRETTQKILEFIQNIIKNLISENLDEDVFYNELFNKVFDNILFPNNLEKICAITILVIDQRIPYFKLGKAMQMNNESFAEICSSIRNDIDKAFFILSYGYEQKTEVASQLYELINSQQNDEQKIVLLSNILGYYSTRIQLLIDKLSENDS